MGWNPFKDISNFVSDVGNVVDKGFSWVGDHPLETAAAAAALYFGMPPTELLAEEAGSTALANTAASTMFDMEVPAAAASSGFGWAGEAGALSLAGEAAGVLDLGFGAGGFASSGLGPGAAGASAAPAGAGSSMYSQMTDYLRRTGGKLGSKVMGMSGKDMAYSGAGLLGLTNAMQAQRQAQLPNPGDVKSLPGYQAGLDAVMASMAQQGYTGGSNAAAQIGKYGGDFYNQAVNQRLASAQGGMSAGVNQLGSLALLAKGFGLF